MADDGSPTERPSIDAVSSSDLVPGQTITIDVTSARVTSRVTLLKAGSVTHSVSMEPRFLEHPFGANAGTLRATLPLNEANITPGYYLLSVLNGEGPPSESKIVRVASPTPTKPVAGVDGQIVRLYRAYFLRPPDEGGSAYWIGQRNDGVTLSTVSNRFAGSEEFTLRYGGTTDAEFVTLVYENVLERLPDAGGHAYWVEQLATRAEPGRSHDRLQRITRVHLERQAPSPLSRRTGR